MSASDPKRWWPAPAKLNLCLHVTGRRADGYHELQTIFQLISLADQLSFDLRDDGRIVRLDYEGAAAGALSTVGEDQDLCVRAARALQLRTGAKAGAAIRIRKHIPVGGGLGGELADVGDRVERCGGGERLGHRVGGGGRVGGASRGDLCDGAHGQGDKGCGGDSAAAAGSGGASGRLADRPEGARGPAR